MTDELTIAKDQFLLDCMHELNKVKNEHSTNRDTLSKVRTKLADTTNADLANLHQEISHIRHRRLTQHSEAEYELQQTTIQFDTLNIEQIETKLELRRCRFYIRDLTSTTTSNTNIHLKPNGL